MSHPEPAQAAFEPRRPLLLATLVFALATLSVCWPMLGGRFLLGDDQYTVGYAFRLFGAELTRATGAIPHWNPYLFGGLPFIGGQHGDIFYPTAWLRLALEVDTAINLGWALHLLLAGLAMYGFLRALGTGWGGAVVGGVAYQLTGIVASLVSPGHDGKLFVSALAPLLFLGLTRAVRDRRPGGYALVALVTGLCLVSPHYQMTYYLLVGGGLWTLYLAFGDPERPAGLRWPVALGLAFGAVLVGLAIAAVQIVPFLGYLPYAARGANGGWEYATSYSMPPEELFTTILPQFNGVLAGYWGRNFFKLHTEYLGAVVVLLAAFGWRSAARRRTVLALTGIAVLFLLISFGGHTPFYRLWYEVMPLMKKVRAPGMAFFMVALPVAVLAGFGADRLFRRDVSPRSVLIGAGILGAIALLAVTGALAGVGRALVAVPDQFPRLEANVPALQRGGLRLLLVVLGGGAVLWAVAAGRLRGGLAALALAAVVAADLWSVDRLFFRYQDPAERLFRDDAVTRHLAAQPRPFRVLDNGVYGQLGSILMAYDVQQTLGYHGNEVRFYDELMGGKNVWQYVTSPNVLELTATRFLVLPQQAELPGWRQVAATMEASTGAAAVLYERDTAPAYARVVPEAARLPEAQIVPTLADPRFPVDRVLLYPDTASVPVRPLGDSLPEPSAVRATVSDWAPGRVRVALDGRADRPAYLMVSETWVPGWEATVDGRPADVHRADEAFLSVVLPPGAREVTFLYRQPGYAAGRLVSLLALALTAAIALAPRWLRRRPAGG